MGISNLLTYAQTLNGSGDVEKWLETTGKKALKKGTTTESELEHVIDFFVSQAAPKRLLKMSLKDALRKTSEWTQANQKKGRDLVEGAEDVETLYDFGDGTRIVKLLTPLALKREGFLMSHCVGGYQADSTEYNIYSYRDAANQPHATFEVRLNAGEIVQIKGKGNGPVHPKYIAPILQFLDSIGMKIRPRDMRNLGYYHADSHLEFLRKNFAHIGSQLVEVRGEWYAI